MVSHNNAGTSIPVKVFSYKSLPNHPRPCSIKAIWGGGTHSNTMNGGSLDHGSGWKTNGAMVRGEGGGCTSSLLLSLSSFTQEPIPT